MVAVMAASDLSLMQRLCHIGGESMGNLGESAIGRLVEIRSHFFQNQCGKVRSI